MAKFNCISISQNDGLGNGAGNKVEVSIRVGEFNVKSATGEKMVRRKRERERKACNKKLIFKFIVQSGTFLQVQDRYGSGWGSFP